MRQGGLVYLEGGANFVVNITCLHCCILGDLGNTLLAVVNAFFALMAILGVVSDPTTAGVADSIQAMTYQVPKKKK